MGRPWSGSVTDGGKGRDCSDGEDPRPGSQQEVCRIDEEVAKDDEGTKLSLKEKLRVSIISSRTLLRTPILMPVLELRPFGLGLGTREVLNGLRMLNLVTM